MLVGDGSGDFVMVYVNCVVDVLLLLLLMVMFMLLLLRLKKNAIRKYTRKVKVLSLPETIKEKSTLGFCSKRRFFLYRFR